MYKQNFSSDWNMYTISYLETSHLASLGNIFSSFPQ